MKTSHKDVQLAEVGPRFEMKRKVFTACYDEPGPYSLRFPAYEIRQGTIEQNEADKEWVLTSYTRTSKKRRLM